MKRIFLAIMLMTVTLLATSTTVINKGGNNNPIPQYTEDGGRIITLVVYRYHSAKRLHNKLNAEKKGEAHWYTSGNNCEIFYQKNDLKTAGHELKHCLDGAYH